MSKSNRSGKSKCLNKEQLESFISNLPQKYGLLAETMYFLAARVGEATSIRVRNINSNYQVVTLEKMTTKCKETREIPIGSKLLSDLQGWISDNDLKDDDYIFFSSSRNIKQVPGSKKLSINIADLQVILVF